MKKLLTFGLAALAVSAPMAFNAVEVQAQEAYDIRVIIKATDSDYWQTLLMAAEAMVEDFKARGINPEGKSIFVISATAGSAVNMARTNGFIEKMQSLVPSIKVIETQYADNDIAVATDYTLNTILANEDLVGIFGDNNHMGIGIANAIVETGKKDAIVTYVFDSSPDEIAAIEAGTLTGIVVQDPFGMGYNGVNYAVKALKGGKRDKVIVASKGGLLWNEKRETTNNLSKQSLLKEADESLVRLGVDHIDIYQMHWPDPNVALEETAEALQILKDAGKIRYIGISNFSKADALKMHELVGVDCQQSLYNMFERNTDMYHGIELVYKTEKEILPMVKELGQAFLPYSPLFQGLLAGKFTSGISFSKDDIRNAKPKLVGADFEKYFNAANELKALSEEYSRPMNEIALNWLVQKPEVTSIIGGASTIAQIEKNCHCTTWEIDAVLMEKIEKIIVPFENVFFF